MPALFRLVLLVAPRDPRRRWASARLVRLRVRVRVRVRVRPG